MDLIVKVTRNFTDGITEIYKPINLKYEDSLFSSGSMSFEVLTRSDDLKNLDLFQKIELFYQYENTEYSIWNGYISNINVKLPRTIIKCLQSKEYLKRKQVYSSTQINGTPQEIVQPLLDDVNSRKGANEANLTFSSDITDVYQFKASKGTLHSALTSLATLFKAQMVVEKNTIYFRKRIGQDRLNSPDFVEVVSSLHNPMFNTLADVDVNLSSNTLLTRAVIKNNNGGVNRIRNTETYGSIEGEASVNDGDIDELADAYIDKYSQPVKVYKINVNDRSIGVLDVYIGDTVWLRVEQDIELIDTFEPYRITGKTVDFKYGKPRVSLSLSNKDLSELRLKDVLGDMMERIKGLENKI